MAKFTVPVVFFSAAIHGVTASGWMLAEHTRVLVPADIHPLIRGICRGFLSPSQSYKNIFSINVFFIENVYFAADTSDLLVAEAYLFGPIRYQRNTEGKNDSPAAFPPTSILSFWDNSTIAASPASIF